MRLDNQGIAAFTQQDLSLNVGKDTIKSLTQSERKTLEAVLGAIEHHATSVEVDENVYNSMKGKLENQNPRVRDETRGPVLRLITSIVKGIMNIFHLRISSDEVFQDFQRVHNKKNWIQVPKGSGSPDIQHVGGQGGGIRSVNEDKGAAYRKLGMGIQILAGPDGDMVRINHVFKGGQIEKAGFQHGDILVKATTNGVSDTQFAGKKEDEVRDVILDMAHLAPVKVTVERRGELVDVTLPQIPE